MCLHSRVEIVFVKIRGYFTLWVSAKEVNALYPSCAAERWFRLPRVDPQGCQGRRGELTQLLHSYFRVLSTGEWARERGHAKTVGGGGILGGSLCSGPTPVLSCPVERVHLQLTLGVAVDPTLVLAKSVYSAKDEEH